MLRPRRVFAGILLCLAAAAAAQTRDELAAQRALGPHWRKIARSAGTIFVGTVLGVENARTPGQSVPIIQIRFRVEHPIAGMREAETFTLREWSGAWSIHRPMRRGEKLLVFLYAPSRLGLSSPVGGALGQIPIDPGGQTVTARSEHAQMSRLETGRTRKAHAATVFTIQQLERAIRSARAGD